MNENEKELTGTTPELTEPSACQGVNESAAPEVAPEAKEACAETESPAEAIAQAADAIEAKEETPAAPAASDNVEVKEAEETCQATPEAPADACAETESPAEAISEATDAIEGADQEAADAKEDQKEELREEERVNYHSLTKSELVDALRQIVDTKDASAHKKVAAVKQAFYTLRNREIQAEMDEYVEAGNAPETFTASLDEAETQLKDLLSAFREIRSQYLNAEEERKRENLVLKQKIIDQLRQLADDIDNINLHFPKFQQLQADFKAITDIPAGDVADTWKNYQLAVEQFYDRLKMNKELRDLDFRKNLEYKRTLIDQAKALETEPDPVAAFRKLQDLHEKWRETGPVAKDMRESIWDEFKAASTVVNKRHQEFFEARKAQETANEKAKTELCEQIEAIDMSKLDSFKAWDAETKHVLELQAEWKKLGFASRKVNTALFNRFRSVCDDFFTRKAAYFKSVKDEYAANMAKKVALCEQVEALKESEEDNRKAMETVTRLQAEWRKIGPVARKNSDAIWQRFNEACNYFYKQRKQESSAQRQEENANLAAKRAIVAALKAIDLDDIERNEAIKQVRELQKQWSAVGHVPFRQKDTLFTEYRQVCDKLYAQLDMSRQQARMSSFEEQLAGMDADKAKLMRERERLSRAYEGKKNELNTAENNLGFFNVKSSEGSSLVRDMERRIKRLREDLELIAQQISAVNQKLK